MRERLIKQSSPATPETPILNKLLGFILLIDFLLGILFISGLLTNLY